MFVYDIIENLRIFLKKNNVIVLLILCTHFLFFCSIVLICLLISALEKRKNLEEKYLIIYKELETIQEFLGISKLDIQNDLLIFSDIMEFFSKFIYFIVIIIVVVITVKFICRF
jgi:hypothetical protein